MSERANVLPGKRRLNSSARANPITNWPSREPNVNSNVWTITLKDVTRGESFSQTVPYTSTHATAEWISETPLLIGTNAGLAALPNLTTTPFTKGTTNGQNAGLKSSEEMQLIDSNGNVIGAPSAPNGTTDGFNTCSWATSC